MKRYVCVLTRGDKNITNMSCQHVKLQNEFHKLLLGMKQRQHLTLAHNYSYQMCPFLKGRTWFINQYRALFINQAELYINQY